MKNNKVVLAFSGGLDTSYCVKYLKNEKGLEIYSAIVNTGGFSIQELEEIKQKALNLGVKNHVALEETEAYYDNIIKYLTYNIDSMLSNTIFVNCLKTFAHKIRNHLFYNIN